MGYKRYCQNNEKIFGKAQLIVHHSAAFAPSKFEKTHRDAVEEETTPHGVKGDNVVENTFYERAALRSIVNTAANDAYRSNVSPLSNDPPDVSIPE